MPHQVLGLPMHAWKNFTPPGMLLRSEAFASNLYAPWGGYTVEDWCRRNHIEYKPVGLHLPVEMFVDYGQWFQSELVGLSVRSKSRTCAARMGISGWASATEAAGGPAGCPVAGPEVVRSGAFGAAQRAKALRAAFR
ncbi:hypothetical protein ACTMU2_41495 [Cupriavidus basilensis]